VQHVEPADLGELQVEQDEGGGRRLTAVDRAEIIDSLGTVAGHHDLVVNVVLGEGPDGQGLIIGVIFHQQDTPVAHSASAGWRVR
jgi:hypothetical protein